MKIYTYQGRKNVSGEKIRQMRNIKRMSQSDLAAKMQVEGVMLERDSISRIEGGERFVADYELRVFAKVLGVDVKWLLTEDEEFVVQASEQYGSRGMKQAKDLIEGMSGLFAGGTLSEQDKDAVMKALQDIYWESKARNVVKYTPKKYKKTGTDAEE